MGQHLKKPMQMISEYYIRLLLCGNDGGTARGNQRKTFWRNDPFVYTVSCSPRDKRTMCGVLGGISLIPCIAQLRGLLNTTCDSPQWYLEANGFGWRNWEIKQNGRCEICLTTVSFQRHCAETIIHDQAELIYEMLVYSLSTWHSEAAASGCITSPVDMSNIKITSMSLTLYATIYEAIYHSYHDYKSVYMLHELRWISLIQHINLLL